MIAGSATVRPQSDFTVDIEAAVENLGDKLLRAPAVRVLREAGAPAVALVRAGLRHPDPDVRAGCAGFLDRCELDDETTRSLVLALDDPAKSVRASAAHTLACEVCKPDEGPSTDVFLERVLEVLAADPSAKVRQTAAGTLGQHKADPRVLAALEAAHLTDPHTKVRLHAGWAIRRRVAYIHQLHPPDEIRLFTVPRDAIRRPTRKGRRRKVLVYDALHSDTHGLRHYAFADRWFAVNVTLDLGGVPVEHGDDGFAYNCDISTPFWWNGARAYEVDLELDVLVRADGRSYEVTDLDGFERACDEGWITGDERDGALRGLDELLEIVESGRLHAFLDEVCPFGDIRDAPQAIPYERLRPELYPQLRPDIR